jgi:toluene monooxygenase electron transfer component
MKHNILIEGGEAFAVSAEEDTLLRGALRAGVGLPHECSVGGCGACRFDLVSGEMETLWGEASGLSERDRKRGKRLACQSRPLGDCTIRVRCGEEYRPPIVPQRQPARLKGKRQLTADTIEFTFHIDTPADFLPGQYAMLYPLRTIGARAYSMANLANDDGLWQFVIRRVPGGRGSNALFDSVGIGDTVPLDGPYGHAYLRRDNQRDIVCIAGGSGLAPMLSVAKGALRGLPCRVHFFDGARTVADLCGEAMLDEFQARSDRLTYTPVLSAADAAQPWQGATGFVHEVVASALVQPLDSYEFYFAGPPPMIEAMQDLLMTQHRVPYQQIHFDRFL